MENLLMIEIFNGKMKSVVKTKIDSSKCETSIIESVEHILSNINYRYLIKIYGTFDKKGIVFFLGNVLMVDVIDPVNKVRKTLTVMSVDELIDVLCNINIDEINRKHLLIKNYTQLLFTKETFMTIIALTQQYLMKNTFEVENKINIDVITQSGIHSLFKNGKSERITEPIIGLKDFENINYLNIDNNKLLWAFNLNNYITSVNLVTGTYYFGFEVRNNNNEVDVIHFKRSCKDFWGNIKVYKNNEDVFWGIDKGEVNCDKD